MQLVEFIVWSKGLPQNTWNYGASLVAGSLLILQPFASIMLLDDGMFRRVLLAGYAVFLLINAFDYSSVFKMTVAKNGHLQWHFIKQDKIFTWHLIVYIILLLAPLLYSPKYRWVFVFAFVTVIISIYTYAKDNTWGSMWCWLGNLITLALIIKILFIDHYKIWCSRETNGKLSS